MPRPLVHLLLALVWLTRLPFGRWLPPDAPVLARAAWAFPLVGLVVGGIGAAALTLAQTLELSPALAGLLAVGAMILTTGALHEDGLADLADGMGGRDPKQRLEIMRDSRIGSYGVLALIVVTGVRALAVSDAGALALITAAVLSRAAIVVVMVTLPQARTDGLSQSAGHPTRQVVMLACGLALVIGAVLTGLVLPVVVLIVALVTLWMGRLARQRLGGRTGDVLGAVQQCAEAAALIGLAAL
ncbi:MAG: adenosylcobinamide-GDP ribazoletransferase [Paracoccus sp. (in: a-proteobacteria)]|uniref:adenosylcobinamide-GDP ribazoletransferase n=1 Tax=Paracoccus sp. TaxID=267 RepID=UPI0026E0FDFE|nr:adenosylcobinamide-GDP ribazoletransferase [Paracoccus sp. (in: a-proteobacteria)]MDO5621338.1 adenosylcobinamide-GDP ribazoletransferase [Paracoccus sp. (in: a-proteobacteria)]